MTANISDFKEELKHYFSTIVNWDVNQIIPMTVNIPNCLNKYFSFISRVINYATQATVTAWLLQVPTFKTWQRYKHL